MYYGAFHPKISLALNHVGGALYELNENEQARAVFEEALHIDLELARSDGANQSRIARDWAHLGGAYLGLKNFVKAVECFDTALRLTRRIEPIDDSIVARCLSGLGSAWMERGKLSRAKAYFEKTLSIHQNYLEEKHRYIAGDLMKLAIVTDRIGDLDSALHYCRQAFKLYKKSLGKKHKNTHAARNLLRKIEKKSKK